MNIKRMNLDLGNSLTGSIVNGEKNIIEMPTSIVKLTKAQATDYFPDFISPAELKDSLIIEHNGEYFLIGKAAEMKLGNDRHVNDLHDKSTSNIPYHMFLACIAVYQAERFNEDDNIYVDYFSTMLPIYELLQADKFSVKLSEMANRFKGKHVFSIITKGCEKELTVHVKEAKAYPEGLAAKFALQYQTDLTPNPSADRFRENYTINVDLGGGTIDMVRLAPGLKKPKSREDFQAETGAPYLRMIKDLRERKLVKYFDSSRELEAFIVNNYKYESYVWVNGKTGETVDLTEQIDDALRNYTETIMEIVFDAYPRLEGNKFYMFNYFGGVAPILRKYIREYLEKNHEATESYHHIEPDHTARFLNLYGLEIISRQNTMISN